jgi:hypothetical protein
MQSIYNMMHYRKWTPADKKAHYARGLIPCKFWRGSYSLVRSPETMRVIECLACNRRDLGLDLQDAITTENRWVPASRAAASNRSICMAESAFPIWQYSCLIKRINWGEYQCIQRFSEAKHEMWSLGRKDQGWRTYEQSSIMACPAFSFNIYFDQGQFASVEFLNILQSLLMLLIPFISHYIPFPQNATSTMFPCSKRKKGDAQLKSCHLVAIRLLWTNSSQNKLIHTQCDNGRGYRAHWMGCEASI